MAISSRSSRRHSSNIAVPLALIDLLIAKDSRERYITGVVGPRAYNIRVHIQTFHSDRIHSSPSRPDGYLLYVPRSVDFAIFYLDFFINSSS